MVKNTILCLPFLLALQLCLDLQVKAQPAPQKAAQAQPTTTQSPNADTSAKSEMEQKAARALKAREDARKEQKEALARIEKSIALSKERRTELEAEIAQLKSDRETVQTDLIATADRIKKLEANLTKQEARLKTLFEDQTALKVALAEQRDSLSEILAALQRIGRNPPPALAIRPNEALSAVRSAILLSTLVPEIRLEAQALAAQLTALLTLQKQIQTEQKALQASLGKMEEERKRLDLLIAKKQEQEKESLKAAANENEKIAALALKASGLQELINTMEQEIEAARLAVAEAKEAERRAIEQEIETKKQRIAALKNAARLSPAIPFDKMKGLLRLPAQGAIIKSFGSADGFGGATEGLSVATRAGAQVTSPADGWIVYSGPFRSFGKLLIIKVGGGYHIVLAGLESLSAEVGSFVLANEPIGRMQKSRLANADLLSTGSNRPVLYMELRQDGAAIDPAPWWTVAMKEKADG